MGWQNIAKNKRNIYRTTLFFLTSCSNPFGHDCENIYTLFTYTTDSTGKVSR